MKVEASSEIKTTLEKLWKTVIDIENAQNIISAIEHIEILHKPKTGFINLKWKEKRIMFGKEAMETMWISKGEENKYYETQANNCGCLYTTQVSVKKGQRGVILTYSFDALPQTFMAKIMSPVSFLFRGMLKKAFENDLRDIKNYLEKS